MHREGPIRDVQDMLTVNAADVRPITLEDFLDALSQIRTSVSPKDLELYIKFDEEFGSVTRKKA